MLYNREIFYLDSNFKECYEQVLSYEFNEITFRIFTENLKELKVALNNVSYNYETIAISKNDKIYHVTL